MGLVEAVKSFINLLTDPPIFITLASVLFLLSLRYKAFWKPRVALVLGVAGALFLLSLRPLVIRSLDWRARLALAEKGERS